MTTRQKVLIVGAGSGIGAAFLLTELQHQLCRNCLVEMFDIEKVDGVEECLKLKPPSE